MHNHYIRFMNGEGGYYIIFCILDCSSTTNKFQMYFSLLEWIIEFVSTNFALTSNNQNFLNLFCNTYVYTLPWDYFS